MRNSLRRGGCSMKKIISSLLFCNGCISSKEISEGYDNATAPNIMVNNRHYHTAGEVLNEVNFDSDGTITSSVNGSELSYKNDQSNFGTGYEYAIVNDDIIYVHINEKWIKYLFYIPD